MLDTTQGASGPTRWLRHFPWLNLLGVAAVFLAATLIAAKNLQGDTSQILNVSYDPTRELYAALDAQFVAQYQQQTGVRLEIKQSHERFEFGLSGPDAGSSLIKGLWMSSANPCMCSLARFHSGHSIRAHSDRGTHPN
jgi:hypothetical protein